MKHGGLTTADLKAGLYRLCATTLLLGLAATAARAEDGYELWMRYRRVADAAVLKQYRSAVTSLLVSGDSATARAVSVRSSAAVAIR